MAFLRIGGHCGKVGRPSPPTHAERHLEVSVVTLQQVELLEVAVEIVSLVIPAVGLVVDRLLGRKVFILVGPRVLIEKAVVTIYPC